MTWPTPKTLLSIYEHATPSELRRHLKWYAEQGYPYLKQLEALVDRKRHTDTAAEKGPQAAMSGKSGGRADGSRGQPPLPDDD